MRLHQVVCLDIEALDDSAIERSVQRRPKAQFESRRLPTECRVRCMRHSLAFELSVMRLVSPGRIPRHGTNG
jgi:hypothetical protein